MEKLILVPYDKYQRMLEAHSVKTVTVPKPQKKEKDQMPCPPPGKRDTSTHRNRKLT